ncbi:hypothetical protein J6590_012717 [Homalodisca vitripennis]|nr:hypothetical protein J6590_012717 [Homalodisca vitripennis]
MLPRPTSRYGTGRAAGRRTVGAPGCSNWSSVPLCWAEMTNKHSPLTIDNRHWRESYISGILLQYCTQTKGQGYVMCLTKISRLCDVFDEDSKATLCV